MNKEKEMNRKNWLNSAFHDMQIKFSLNNQFLLFISF